MPTLVVEPKAQFELNLDASRAALKTVKTRRTTQSAILAVS